MDYLTNYYKNLCEDLERKIQNLLDILHEDAVNPRWRQGPKWEKFKQQFGELPDEKFENFIKNEPPWSTDPEFGKFAREAREAWKKDAAARSAQEAAENRRRYEEATRRQGTWTWNNENPTGEQPRAEEPRSGSSSSSADASDEAWRRSQDAWERDFWERQSRGRTEHGYRNADDFRRAYDAAYEEARRTYEEARRRRSSSEQPRSGSSSSSEDYSWRNPDPAYEEEMYRRQWQEDEVRRAQERYEEVKRYTDAMRAKAEEMKSRSVGAKVSRVVDSLKGMSRSRGGRLAGGAALAVPIAIGVGKVGSMIGDLFANDINPKNPDLNSPGYSNINQYPKLSDIQKDTLFKGMKGSTDMDRIKTYDMVRSAEEREKQRQLEKIEREGTVLDDELIPSLSDDEWLAAHEKYLKRRETQMQVPEPTKERMEPVSPYPFYQRGD